MEGPHDLALRPLAIRAVVHWIDEIVVRLGQPAHVGKLRDQEQAQLAEDRPAQRDHPLLLPLAKDAERAPQRVEVSDLDARELVSADPEDQQAEQR